MVLILGAMSDIGRALAHQMAKEGHSLYLAARNAERLQADAADLAIRYKIDVRIVSFDAEKWDTHRAFYDALVPKPEVVIYVIGNLGRGVNVINAMEKIQAGLAANFTGAVSILEIVAQDMKKRGKGTIVGISSVAGERGRQSNYLYGSAKAGFTAYLSGLRNSLYPSGVHVLTVKPGFVYTAMTEGMPLPQTLTCTPEAVAQSIYRAMHHKKNVLYVKPIWRWIMWIIRNIPEGIFKRLKL